MGFKGNQTKNASCGLFVGLSRNKFGYNCLGYMFCVEIQKILLMIDVMLAFHAEFNFVISSRALACF